MNFLERDIGRFMVGPQRRTGAYWVPPAYQRRTAGSRAQAARRRTSLNAERCSVGRSRRTSSSAGFVELLIERDDAIELMENPPFEIY